MADIFISWGSPDKTTVEKLTSRLLDVGFSVFEYSRSMKAGDQIPNRVMDEIAAAKMVVFCLSDASVPREWITTETAWAAFAQRYAKLEHQVPVRVGVLTPNTLPASFVGKNLFQFDLATPESLERDLCELVEHITGKLRKVAPIVVPAALFSMTKAQGWELFKQYPPNDTTLQALCAQVGMTSPPALWDLLAERYGDLPEDLAPFPPDTLPDKTLLQMLNQILRKVNVLRLKARHRPIHLRWMHNELTDPRRAVRERAEGQWIAGDSFLVVDSISMYHPEIKQKLFQLPESQQPARAAVLWIPPYTRYTAVLEKKLNESASVINRLGAVYRFSDGTPERSIAFDTATPSALRLWLHRAFAGMPDEMTPVQENVEEMIQDSVRIDISEMMATFGGGGR